ncbi:MAG: helix-turn-helix domain-containing protein [Bacteriovoracia bacterium]
MNDLLKNLPDNINITVTKADLIAFAHEIIKEFQHSNNQAASSHPIKSILKINEAADLIGFSPATIYAKTSKGEIPHYKRGNTLFFKADELAEWLTETRGFYRKDIEEAGIKNLSR